MAILDIDPEYMYVWRRSGIYGGEACVANTRIPCRVLADFYSAGESIRMISRMYELPEDVVVNCILFHWHADVDYPPRPEGWWEQILDALSVTKYFAA